jgi:hypothetical protein
MKLFEVTLGSITRYVAAGTADDAVDVVVLTVNRVKDVKAHWSRKDLVGVKALLEGAELLVAAPGQSVAAAGPVLMIMRSDSSSRPA